jgi:hypothetical protein
VRGSEDYFLSSRALQGTSGGPCRGFIFEFKRPPVNAACALLLLSVEEAEAVAVAVAEAVTEDEAEAEGFTLARLEFILKITLKTT